ncbi:MAG: 30S ribosomal protein S4 [Thermoplasmatota archaeon]|nr:30S ribosomal protein S4 [Candidatus Thermoplasmatota archaeon]MBU1915094.1 30S ribosomal protein S4 [Candidatus Thermoplasmatota archaeon]
MGDPKFSRRKYETPAHPWEGERIKTENEIVMKYGLKNKRELWRAQSLIRSLRAQSRELQARVRTGDPQAKIETDQLLARCARMSLLTAEGATLNDVLVLTTEAVLARRLQTIVYRKGLSYTPKQARQFIVHGHAAIGDRKITIPGYLVRRGEEEQIQYHSTSPIANDLHPVRPKPEELQAKAQEEAAKKELPKKDEIHVAKPKLKKLVTAELKEEKEDKEADIETANPPEPEEEERKE